MAGAGSVSAGSTAFFTDHYELTMLDAAIASGVASHRAVFEAFARRLPPGRAYGVVGGTARLLEEIQRFRFGDAELSWLAGRGFLAPATLEWLAEFRFSGTIDGYREGEVFFAGSPVLTVESAFGEAVLLETLVLSVLNFDSAVAATAARMVGAAAGRGLIEMGGRRTHEVAAVAAARIACALGFTATSNLEAGRRWGVPTAGTAAHAFVLAHGDDASAFAAQIARLGTETTLLVDTFDTAAGIRAAVSAAHAFGAPGPGAIRIDSGDLAAEARRARKLLDELGATETAIVASGDLDEFSIFALENGPDGRAPDGRAPIDAYGVGTRLVTGSGAPTADMIYKLVAVSGRPSAPGSSGAGAALSPVAKRSIGKETIGGRKVAWRELDDAGAAVREWVAVEGDGPPLAMRARLLQVPLVVDGEVVYRPSLEEIGVHHRLALAELGPRRLSLRTDSPLLEVRLHDGPVHDGPVHDGPVATGVAAPAVAPAEVKR